MPTTHDDEKLNSMQAAMMQALSNIVGCDCPGEKPGDYRDSEGLLVCGVCGQRKETRREVPYLGTRVHLRNCDCENQRLRKAEIAKQVAKEQETVRELLEYSIIDTRFRESKFENFKKTEHNERQLRIALGYVKRFDDMFQRNKGLLFYGEPSTGKTFLASCIANALLEKRVPLIVTSMLKITASSGPFSKEEEQRRVFLNKMNAAKVIFIDDLGTERDTSYKMEQVFEFFDSRYAAKKPMIVTTNLTMWQMQNEQNIRLRRVFERLFEVCHPVEFTGPSWRWQAAEDGFDEIEDMLLKG